MIFLIGSIIFSSFLTIALKVCSRLKIDTFQAIIFNYLTCIITGIIINGNIPSVDAILQAPWFMWAVVMGAMFIIFFNLTAATVKQSGVAVTAVATKLSLVIPFVFTVLFYKEAAGVVKIAGIILALIAVVLTCYPSGTETSHKRLALVLPFLLFLGTGATDALIKLTEKSYVSGQSRDTFLVTCFTVAFIIGGIIYLIRLFTNKISFQPKAIPAGICIGIPNYLSIYCLVIVLKKYDSSSSVILPVNNIGIVFVSALVAWLFFKENLSRLNWTGIFLAGISILLITSNFTD